jgi:hypothetical protein
LIQSVIYWVVLMRLVPVFALMTSAFALAACAGGGGGAGELSAAGIRASKGSVCGVLEKDCIPPSKGGGTTSAPDSDGDGIPDSEELPEDGGIGGGAGGNNTVHKTGNKTIALEKFVLDVPDPKKGKTAISQITSELKPTFVDTEADVMANTKSKSLKFSVNTNSDHNGQWAIPAELPLHAVGTRDLRWIWYGHTTVPPASFNIRDQFGNAVVYSPALWAFVYNVDAPDGSYLKGDQVEHFTDDFYWNQITPYMGSKANGGAKDNYTEYFLKSDNTKLNRDEALQVWNWKNSYAVNYHNDIGLLESKQQAWSFGGNEATNMKTSGKSRYAGRFVATAKTEGFGAPDGAKINPNALWMVEGRTDLKVDFDNSSIDGTLSPETWTSKQEKHWYTWWTSEAGRPTAGNAVGTPSVATREQPDLYKVFGTKVLIDGEVVAGEGGTTKNAIEGTASLSGRYQSSDNPVYGGFFGKDVSGVTNANELTGIFNVNGTLKELTGGSSGNTDPQEATMKMNGAFNGQCVASAGYTCDP